MAKARNARIHSFGQLLVTYSVMLIAILVVLAGVLFAIVFNQLSAVQQQTSRYAAILQLASHLSAENEAFNRLIFRTSTEEQKQEALADISAAESRAKMMVERLDTAYETNPQQYFLLRGIENGLDFIAQQRELLMQNMPLDTAGYSRYYKINTTFSYLNNYVYTRFLSSAVAQNAEEVEKMQSSIARIRTLGIVLVLVLAIIYTFAIVLVIRSLVYPMQAMVETASEITKGNLDTPDLPVGGPSEIRFLEQSLNSMKASLKERITALDENAKLEKRLHQQELQQIKTKRELDRARLLTLQAQINPHFLFNAMNTISRTALFENAESTADLVTDLADLFRYMLDQRTTVPLFEEIDFIGKYLKIQKIRFGDRLDYSVSCPNELRHILIPPLIIQPFVENSIIHGLEPLEEGGTVTIGIENAKRSLIITVEDTGIGIGEGKMSEIILQQSRIDNEHIGMFNVMERIKLYYGGTATMAVFAREPSGTVIRLSLPVRKQDRMGG